MIDTEQELLRTLATLPHRWVAREPTVNRSYVTGEPFPTVTPDVVFSAIKRRVLVEYVPGLWSQAHDAPPAPRRRRRPKPQ